MGFRAVSCGAKERLPENRLLGYATRMKRLLVLACFIAFCSLAPVLGIGPGFSPALAQETFRNERLTVVGGGGGRYPFDVEIAETFRQRAQGLQGRRQLAPGSGMLFNFKNPQLTTMWMKNTFVALDMIFIDAGGTIIKIVRETTPKSLSIIESGGPVLGVLEVRAGTAARLGIKKGDRVEHRIFQ